MRKVESNIDNLAVVYARYSSHGQKEQSIEGQLSAARAYAKTKGYTIIHEYIDRAMTGRNDNRAEFQRMLADTAKKQFRVVIVWKVDRFGRNREEITFNKYRCKKNGVRVEYVAESVPDSAEGVILESVLEGMAEYYSLQLAQNVSRGLLESAKKHRVLGRGAPLGYTVDADKHHAIDPKTAPIVQMIFDMYVKGNTLTAIANHLNSQGFRSSWNTPFSIDGLYWILRNEAYIGVYKFKDIIRDEGVIPAIVDKETFDKAQAGLDGSSRLPSSKWKYRDYILTGKLFCGKCGSPMKGASGTSKSGTHYGYYRCQKKRLKQGCTKKNVQKAKLEDAVLRAVQELVMDDKIMEFITDCTWQYYLYQADARSTAHALQAQLDTVEKSIANLVSAIERGAASEAIVNRMAELEGQKTALRRAIADENNQQGPALTRDHISFFLEQFRNLDYTDRECQRRLLNVFVNAIFLYDDEFTLVFNFGEESRTITLAEKEKAEAEAGGVFAQHYIKPTLSNLGEHRFTWFSNVFMVTMKMPGKG